MINILNVLCKSVVLAYNAMSKKQTADAAASRHYKLSFHHLFDYLSVGARSDSANSILEALSSCAVMWRRRFEPQLLECFRDRNETRREADKSSSGKVIISSGGSSSVHCVHTEEVSVILCARMVNVNYLLQSVPSVPGMAVFRALSEKLPIPTSVEDFIDRIFKLP